MRKNNKDILLGYIATLPDSLCKEIYYYITGVKNKFDVVYKNVKLTTGQYDKLIWMWGKPKTDRCIKILNDWLEDKSENITKNISHYKQIISWVEQKYYSLYPANDKSMKFNSKIDTEWKARKYVMGIPPELRAYDSEVKYLVNRFGTNILK